MTTPAKVMDVDMSGIFAEAVAVFAAARQHSVLL
jgi:hypothetical protein